jgi:hypothetical protein
LLQVEFALWDRAGIPARRPGNFGARVTSLREVSGPPLRELLSCQKKVTKEEALKTHPGKHLHRRFGW